LSDININGAILCIIVGLIFVLGGKQLGKLIIDFRFIPFKIRFSEKVYQLTSLLLGICFIILGILVVLKII